MTRNFQPEVVFRMFSIAKPTVRHWKDFAGFEARKISKPCCHSRRKVDPEILFILFVLYHAQVSPIPYKSCENTLGIRETRKTSTKQDAFMKHSRFS